MNNPVTSATYIRSLSYSLRRRLSDFLDPQGRWRDVIMSIRNPGGEPRYSQHHVRGDIERYKRPSICLSFYLSIHPSILAPFHPYFRRFEGLLAQGCSPTVELLNDWGTTNSTVGELVDILRQHKLLAAASVLFPVEEVLSVTEAQPVHPVIESELPTRLLTDRKTDTTAVTSTLQGPQARQEPQKPEGPQTLQEPLMLQEGPVAKESSHQTGGGSGFSSFMYSDLMEITGNFDDRPMSDGGSRLGEGGFGTVYKGLLNDKPVAVKKLNPMDDVSPDELHVQFYQEIQTLKVLKHENLVDMVGFSCDGQHPCLVYAFMANGSLLDRLACMENSPPLSWRQRCLIADGAARGLEYLHSNHHVHRDVKSANILLNEQFVAKISDFGLTRASAKRTSTTMMTERIVGTRAYMAPEALRGEITPKSDVFSFGVVLLEILSGLPPASENQEPQFLMEFIYDIDDEDEELTLKDFMDKKMSDWELNQVETTYSLAHNCLNDRKNKRPVIKQVLSELKGVVKSLSVDYQL
ncbi:interleukin-1 receptor-associated kinase 4 isoform X2 [Echeneis naucrates]|uniref:interleukin-1 receptor-associated kinase 4 isoform X2 n=1 Tax=Echeneis naucrates TaxID=173247 RepID=UPI0011144E84|nr:interleukin-1 receptor-associated kinase 4 isoform X2 [Echeneis naucrates]